MSVIKYRGVEIKRDKHDGFYASIGAISFGYVDTCAEIEREIDDHFAEEAAHYADIDTPADTPSLDTSFHDGEMNV